MLLFGIKSLNYFRLECDDRIKKYLLVFCFTLVGIFIPVSAIYAETNGTQYIPLPRPFLFTLMGPVKQRTVQINVQLMVNNEEDSAFIQKHIPLVEDTILKTFSSAEVKKLNTQIGKKELRKNTLLNLQNTLSPLAGREIIDSVLFTGFVMQ